MPAMSRWIQR